MSIQTAGSGSEMSIRDNIVEEPISGLFDRCGKIQERLNEAHVTAARLVGVIPETELEPKNPPDVYLDSLAHRLRDISRDAGNLVKQLQEIERRF